MKTVKLTICNAIDVLDDMRVFSSIVRVAFNRFQDGMPEKEVRAYCNARFQTNSWFVQCAIKEGAALYKLNGDRRILFGGHNNLRQYMRGLIDKATFKYRRMSPIGIQGEKLRKGNRLFLFDLDIFDFEEAGYIVDSAIEEDYLFLYACKVLQWVSNMIRKQESLETANG